MLALRRFTSKICLLVSSFMLASTLTFSSFLLTPTTVCANEIQSESVLYLELMWLNNEVPREALLIVPDEKVPLVILRVLTADEKCVALVVAQANLIIQEEDDDAETAIAVECSQPKLLWNATEAQNNAVTEMPDLILFQGDRGAVDVRGKLMPCLVLSVTPEREKNVLNRYIVPDSAKNSEKVLK